jgi:hypothetical protein
LEYKTLNSSLKNSTQTAKIREARALVAEVWKTAKDRRIALGVLVEESLVAGRVTDPMALTRAIDEVNLADHALAAAKADLQALFESQRKSRHGRWVEIEELAVEEGWMF